MAIIYIYDSTATDFTYNGQPLNKAYEAVVDNMINDSFFVTFNHPLDDKGIYKNIEKDKIVKVHTPDGMQPFRIMDRVKYMDHISIEAWPLFYADMRNKLVKPLAIRGLTGQAALNMFVNNLLIDTPFTFTSNITVAHDYHTQNTEERESNPNQLYNALDVFKDIVKRWQGELVINGYDIRLLDRLGKNTGALLYEKKNISDFTDEESIQDVTTRLYGKSEWTERPQGSDEEVKHEISVKVESPLINAYSGIVFEKQYTNNDIRTEKEMTDWLNLKFTTEHIDKPSRNIKVNTNIVDDTVINLGDSLVLKYVKHDVDMEIRMVGYTYDGYSNRYITVQLGDAKQSYVGNVQNTVREIETNVNNSVKQTVNQILNANGERIINSDIEPVGNFKNGDIWYDNQGGMYFWDEESGMWIDHPYNKNLHVMAGEVQTAIETAEGAKALAVSEAESALSQAKADATAKANAIHEQISGEVNTAISTAEDAKALAVSEAEKALSQAKADATAKANAVKTEVSNSVNTAIDTANNAKQTAIDNYNNAVAEAARLDGVQKTAYDARFGDIEDSVDAVSQSASDADAKAEAIKQGLGLADPDLTNQQITDQIKQDFGAIKSTADTASKAVTNLDKEYKTFLTDKFTPALNDATSALSLAKANEGLFYSANLIDEVTGLSNVYTKAEIDGTNGYVTKAAFKANADTISSEFERIEGVALASGANINLLITRNQKVNTWLDANHSGRAYPTPNDTTSTTATSPDLISVTSGEKITLSKTTTPTDNYFRIDYLDANKKYVNRYTQNANVATITIPANVAYLWASYPLDSYPKIERGEVKTQWTLAPQDQVNQSTVNYLTSKIEQTPGMITEALTGYTKTDSLDETVSSYLTNKTTKTAKAIETKLSDYQKTSDLDGEVVKLLDNTTTQTAGKFNNKLQALEGKIPTEFGGRNLLRGTADFDTYVWRNVSTAMPSTFDSRYKQVRVDGDFTVAPITTMSIQGWNFEVGKEYVISVWAKAEALGNKLGVTAQSTPYFEPQVITVSKWTRYIWKFTATTSSLTNFRFETRNGERVWITQPQIENGSIPSPYGMALEEMATASQTNEIERTANYSKSAITNVTASGLVTGSTINQTKDGITERVARLDTNGNVAYSNREVKLDSIVSTVANDRYISNIIQASDLVQSTIRENTNVDLLAKAASGTGMTADPTFNKGINGLIVYDNANTNTISIYRNLTNDPNLPSGKGYRLDVYHASSTATSPYRGGVALPTQSWANGVVVVRFTAKLEIGKSFVYAQNSIGTGSTHGWLTSNKGTGKWEQYAYYYRFGTSGTFQTFGFISVNATSAAFTWRLADFDIINLGLSSQSQITQLQDNINLKVSKDGLISQFNLSAGNALIQVGTNKLNITPDTTFIEEATIKSAMIDTVNVKKLTGIAADFTSMVTGALTANTITATMINANDAMFTKLLATKLATDKLVAQGAWITDANIASLDAGTIKSGTIATARLDATAIVTAGLSANVVESTHIKAEVALVDKIFSDEARITRLTSNSIFARNIKAIEIDASKITTGELDAARIKSVDVVTAGLSANVVEATHIKAEAGLVGKLFSTTAYIEELTNKTVFTEKIQAINISADKITSGELDASKVSVVKLDANNITANQAKLIQAGFESSSGGSLKLSGDQILSTAKDGSQVFLQNGVMAVRRPTSEGGGTIGQIGYAYDGGSPTYTIQTSWGSHFALKQRFYDSYTKTTNDKRAMFISTGDDGVTTMQFYAADFVLQGDRNLRFGYDHYINGIGTDLTLTGKSSVTLRAKERTVFVVSSNGEDNFASMHANLNMQGNTVTNTSDIRLKRDIVNDEIDSLSALMKWQHAGFNYIDPDMNQERQFGVIAQSAPDIAFAGEDGHLQVALNKQVNMTSHALQQHVIETTTEIESLKAQIASLQDELALLKGA